MPIITTNHAITHTISTKHQEIDDQNRKRRLSKSTVVTWHHQYFFDPLLFGPVCRKFFKGKILLLDGQKKKIRRHISKFRIVNWTYLGPKTFKKNRLSHIHFNLKRHALIIGLTHFTYLWTRQVWNDLNICSVRLENFYITQILRIFEFMHDCWLTYNKRN